MRLSYTPCQPLAGVVGDALGDPCVQSHSCPTYSATRGRGGAQGGPYCRYVAYGRARRPPHCWAETQRAGALRGTASVPDLCPGKHGSGSLVASRTRTGAVVASVSSAPPCGVARQGCTRRQRRTHFRVGSPSAVARAVKQIAFGAGEFCTFRVRGGALGKKRAIPTVAKVRMLLPLSVWMSVLEILLAASIHAACESPPPRSRSGSSASPDPAPPLLSWGISKSWSWKKG